MTDVRASLPLVVRGGTVVTMDARRRVLQADVLVIGGTIVAIGDVETDGARVLDARGRVVIPGFVQAHVHLCQALFRGMADDLPLLAWLRTRIWPLEAAHDEASLAASARLGLAEMIRAGTTTVLDMGTVRHHDAVFDALDASGIRALSGKAMMDAGDRVPRGLRETTRESLRESERLAKRWHGAAGGRLGYAYAPRFVLSCSEKLFRGAVERVAATPGTLLHTHAAEHAEERATAKRILGTDDVEALAWVGVTGPRAVLAHGVQLRADEMRALAKAGTRVVHCPSANLKLASGIADVVAMREAGIVVGLGADGAPCNNRMDPFTELREAALLAKVVRRDAAAMSAMDALALATIDGARALGLDGVTGSLEVGKRADLAVVDVDAPHVLPAGEPAAQIVYACTPSDVRHVVCDGRVLVHDGALVDVDLAALRADARVQAAKVRARAGI